MRPNSPDATARPDRPAAAHLLDVGRLLSRAGNGPLTGIDRVELAYLTELLSRGNPVWGVLRVAGGWGLLDRAGLEAVATLARGARGLPLRADLRARLYWRDPVRARADTAARAFAQATATRFGLARLMRRTLPRGVEYLNVWHSPLPPALIEAIRAVPGARIGVMVHDTIPLDHPAFTRPGQGARFGAWLRRAGEVADRIICNSAHTRAHAGEWFSRWGRVPPAEVAHLGVDLPPGAAWAPAAGRASFLCLGTIEPRKNHALLLDVWARLQAGLAPQQVPRLWIVGRRGWLNREVFDRLDALARQPDPPVVELGAVDDAMRLNLMAGARALVFPAHAEGFGLPLAEAMAMGLPALCTPLAPFREFAGDWPTYLPPDAPEAWARAILALAASPAIHDPPVRAPPDWAAHFDRVLGPPA